MLNNINDNDSQNSQPASPHQTEDFFLPDFCNVRMVFAVVVIGELLAIVLTLAPRDRLDKRWEDLSVISLFVQWVALLSASVLCLARPWLAKLSEAMAATLSYLLLLITATIISEVTYWGIKWITLNGHVIWRTGFLVSNIGISAIVSGVVLRYFYVQHQWGKTLQAKSEARIQALHSRIRPHFLFNSLNTIASLTRIDPDSAEEATEDLADLFRGSLSQSRSEVSLAEEIELCKRYLHIERLRLQDRLEEKWDVNPAILDAMIPQLSLQPLIENAVYHGIEHLRDGGCIHVKAGIKDVNSIPESVLDSLDDSKYESDTMLEICISNPVSDTVRERQRTHNRMAQDNVALRLKALYGNRGRMHVDADTHHYRITLQFPYVKAAS